MSRNTPLTRIPQPLYRRTLTTSVLAALGTVPVMAFAAPGPDPSPNPSPEPQVVEFTSAFLSGSASADLSRFERGNPILPGQQSVDLYVNDALISRETVTFREANNDIQACFDRAMRPAPTWAGMRCPLLADSGRSAGTSGGRAANVRFRPKAAMRI
ncbi:FimD/PapC N-terminal domain-containing protein [Lysobacter changpingensis]|uniref:FimD/PapC N-terminal domain-containing protein n=1 Tax=Lysobacter changpingensis TaxID=2792784 RepID=UPI001A8F457C|nr:FimD/PapC N-terminal domain-containing protein [Lysobacter changpingensis]